MIHWIMYDQWSPSSCVGAAVTVGAGAVAGAGFSLSSSPYAPVYTSAPPSFCLTTESWMVPTWSPVAVRPGMDGSLAFSRATTVTVPEGAAGTWSGESVLFPVGTHPRSTTNSEPSAVRSGVSTSNPGLPLNGRLRTSSCWSRSYVPVTVTRVHSCFGEYEPSVG